MTYILPKHTQGLYSSVTLEWFRTIILALNTITFQAWDKVQTQQVIPNNIPSRKYNYFIYAYYIYRSNKLHNSNDKM